MKKVIKYIGYICCLLLAACTVTDVPDYLTPGREPYYLTLSSQALYFNPQSESKYLEIKSSVDWSFSDYDYWLSLSHSNGYGNSTVTVTAEENLSADISRTSIFYVGTSGNGWSYKSPISVEQGTAAPYIYMEMLEGYMHVPGRSGTHRIYVQSNTEWTVQADGGNWCSFIVADDRSYIDVIVEENNTGYQRWMWVTLFGATSTSFEILQEPATITADNATLSFPRSGGSYLINVTADAAWRAETSSEWLDISQTNGAAGTHEIVISATEYWGTNNRTGYVYFYIGPTAVYLEVTQSRAYINVPSEMTLTGLGEETVFVEVKSNFQWEVLAAPDWLTTAIGTGEQEGMVMLKAENNRSSVRRSGYVVLGKDGFSLYAEMLVTQEGKYFAVNNEALAIGSTGGTMQLSINTNDTWDITLRDQADWLTISDKSGKEKKTVDFIAGDNPSVNTRSATASIAPADLDTVDVVIRQEARYLAVDTYGVKFFSKGGTSEPIVITTDGKYNIECSEDWLSVLSSGTEQSKIFYISAEQNSTEDIRTGTVTVYLTDLIDGEMSLDIKVDQLEEGGNFLRTDYKEDVDLDKFNFTSLELDFIGFSTEDNWDSPQYHGLTLTITGHKEDENWDGNFGPHEFIKDDFIDDSTLDDSSGSGNMDHGGYGEDDSYDPSDGDINVDKEKHPEEDDSYDANWEIDFNKDGYSEDEDYDNV